MEKEKKKYDWFFLIYVCLNVLNVCLQLSRLKWWWSVGWSVGVLMAQMVDWVRCLVAGGARMLKMWSYFLKVRWKEIFWFEFWGFWWSLVAVVVVKESVDGWVKLCFEEKGGGYLIGFIILQLVSSHLFSSCSSSCSLWASFWRWRGPRPYKHISKPVEIETNKACELISSERTSISSTQMRPFSVPSYINVVSFFDFERKKEEKCYQKWTWSSGCSSWPVVGRLTCLNLYGIGSTLQCLLWVSRL